PLTFPLRPSNTTLTTLASHTSHSSANSALNLAILSSQDGQVIDSIISRTPPVAKEFLQVFNAYNQVLEERGMDPSEDVVYYRYLLKLGVVRGTWKERWESVTSSGEPTAALNGGASRPFEDDHAHHHDHDSTTDDTATELDGASVHASKTSRHTRTLVSNRLAAQQKGTPVQPPTSRGRPLG
ncbi:hypothetical protein FRB90_012662, partial [Tulasnella sp. 427]